MKTQAAVLYETYQPFQVQEIEVDEPKAGEVLHLAGSGGLPMYSKGSIGEAAVLGGMFYPGV